MHHRSGLCSKLQSRMQMWWGGIVASWRLLRLIRQVAGNARLSSELQPVAFFNASSRLTGLSLNAAFTFLTACGLQIAGVPVVYFGCHAGMSRCVLGTNRDDYTEPPPCKKCISQSKNMFAHAPVVWFEYSQDEDLVKALDDIGIEELSNFEYTVSLNGSSGIELNLPLGQLVQPSLRWALRRHNLPDSEAVRYLFREYIL